MASKTPRKNRIRTISDLAAEYLAEYRLRHKAVTFAEYAIRHIDEHLGKKMVIQIDEQTVQDYQSAPGSRRRPRRSPSMRKWACFSAS